MHSPSSPMSSCSRHKQHDQLPGRQRCSAAATGTCSAGFARSHRHPELPQLSGAHGQLRRPVVPCTAGNCSAAGCSCNACSCVPPNSRHTQIVQELACDPVMSAGCRLTCILCRSASSTAPFLSLSSISNTVPTMLRAWDSISIRSSWRPPSSENTPPAPHNLCL